MKVVACNTLVRHQLEYASPLWNPFRQSDIYKLEKVQRTAARKACRHWRNQSHVGEMVDDLQWSTFKSRWTKASLSLVYKIHTGQVSIDKDKYLSSASSDDKPGHQTKPNIKDPM